MLFVVLTLRLDEKAKARCAKGVIFALSLMPLAMRDPFIPTNFVRFGSVADAQCSLKTVI
jgi:hypothetical protein